MEKGPIFIFWTGHPGVALLGAKEIELVMPCWLTYMQAKSGEFALYNEANFLWKEH
jgi:hypothetical protein